MHGFDVLRLSRTFLPGAFALGLALPSQAVEPVDLESPAEVIGVAPVRDETRSANRPVVQARFIGNAAFELTDGATTILVDFPYESGAFGYMTFAGHEARFRERTFCLFTHRHPDHFDPGAIPGIGCLVAGPGEVQAAVPAALRAGPGPDWRFGAAKIECIPTAHADVEHCSYLISWHAAGILIAGDIGSLEGLEQVARRAGTILLPSWLAPDIETAALPPTPQIVIDHHRPDEDLPGGKFLVPAQGLTFAILPVDSRDPAAPVPR